MDSQDANFIARVFTEILGMEATRFAIPQRPVAEGEEKPKRRYGVVLDAGEDVGQMFGSILAAKQYINGQ